MAFRVAIVSPQFPFSGRVPMVPPILEYLGVLTLREMPGAELRLHDANLAAIDPAALEADLLGASIPWKGFPRAHFLSLMKQLPMKRALRKAPEEWQRGDAAFTRSPSGTGLGHARRG